MNLRLLDISFPDPALNLALDEVLLENVEHGAQDVLRFWESPSRFVVLGTSQKLQQEVQEEQCTADGVPITRRCTAGGCVLQGPGCLNFTLVLQYARYPDTRTLHGSYCFISERIGSALRGRGCDVRLRGTCDLARDELKVSGNAQRRKRNAMLHHGTLLYQADVAGMQRYLREPEERPGYRGQRTHGEFVAALPFTASALKDLVAAAFEAKSDGSILLQEELLQAETLADSKYRTSAWTRRR